MTRLFLALPIFAAMPLAAQDLSVAEIATLPRVIDSLCVDIYDLNGCENVFLLENEVETDTADLVILPDRRNDATDPMLIVREFAYNGAMWGMSPSLELDEETGRFYIHSEQIGIGRHPWFQTLTVREVDGRPAIIGYDYSTYDRAQGGGYSCSLNLITGDFSFNYYDVDPETGEETFSTDEAGLIDVAPVVLENWTAFGATPEPCNSSLNAFFAREM